MSITKELRLCELGLKNNTSKTSICQKVILKNMMASSDKDLIVKIYLKEIEVGDENVGNYKLIAWMTNTIIGEAIFLQSTNPSDYFEVFNEIFFQITLEVKWEMNSILCECKEEGEITNSNVNFRNVVIITEESCTICEMLMLWYNKIGKCRNIIFNFVENSNLNAINNVINLFRQYCCTEIMFSGKLT